MNEVVSYKRNEIVHQKPELEKKSDIEASVLDWGYFLRLTGCGKCKGDQ